MDARAIIDANRYMTLATADARGTPWASPVWFAHERFREFLWVSDPAARHSQNLAQRPEVALVIFDSSLAPSEAAAVYMSARASEVSDGIEVFSERSVAQGLPAWTEADVRAPSRHRLYRAVATEVWVLGGGDHRVAVPG
jgi:nitroimidazol reductase NimA-like FMN-containing flavoprotein (pyridoxamine 5'-phosphate oxidase superfamily)